MNDEQKRGKEVNDSHLRTIRTNLPQLTAFCGMKAYEGDYSYESLRQYMQEAEQILAQRGNKTTMKKDALVADYIQEHGKEALLELKRNNHNTKLEDCVIGADQQRMLEIVDDHIVPRAGIIYLTPQNRMGRAPFYSSEKMLGSWKVKTLWFNMGVILLMCLITTGLLLTDCPGRYLRKEQ